MGDFLLLSFLKMRLRVLAFKDNGQFGNAFLFPLSDKVWMKLMLGRDLGEALGFFERFQNDRALKAALYCFLIAGGFHLILAHFAVLIYGTVIRQCK